jgi:hypothetical protein
MLQALRQNHQIRFGDAVVRDQSVLLPYRKLFAQAELRECPWSEIKVWSADGCFCVASTREEKTRAAVSYLQTENTHVIETAIRMNLEKGGERLSDLLQ